MPLTPSHAAAALLLRKVAPPLPLGALVIGSLSPDFEYLLRLAPRGSFAHSPVGLVLFCLPASLAVWVVYRTLMRPVVLELLPSGISARFDSRTAGWGLAAAAVLLGALSHVIWDAFTHANGLGVRLLPALASKALPSLVPELRWYKVLQHASTALGALVIVWMTLRWWKHQTPEARRFLPGQARHTVGVVSGLLFVAALTAALNGLRAVERGGAAMLGYTVVGAMIGFALAALTYAGYAHARRQRAIKG